ncbi:MAG: ine55 [Parcubacteria group bacterium]|nr:ine55 [Parcubacteria group bacterium]
MASIPRCVVLEKEIGQTPLEAINVWRMAYPEYADLPATYAGRLDPMASGKLLVLLGEECKKRNAYMGLDKEYEIEVALGISTDTGDALGLAYPTEIPLETSPTTKEIKAALSKLIGAYSVPYPEFSSKTVNGKPLFLYALEGTLEPISIPEHIEHIYKIKVLSQKTISKTELQKRIHETISHAPRSEEPSKVLGADFRQDAIRTQWDSLFSELPERTFTVITLRVSCASGTYMRTLAQRLARELGTNGFALSIRRTKIGKVMHLGPFTYVRDTFRHASH